MVTLIIIILWILLGLLMYKRLYDFLGMGLYKGDLIYGWGLVGVVLMAPAIFVVATIMNVLICDW